MSANDTESSTLSNEPAVFVDGRLVMAANFARFIRIYVLAFIIILGIGANALSIVIFVRCRRKDLASVFYLTYLSVVDFINLVLYTVLFWVEDAVDEFSGGTIYVSTRSASSAVCKGTRYVFDTSRFLSGWIIIAFSVERCIAVWFPMKTAMLLTRKRRVLTGAGMLLFALISNIAVLFYVDVFYKKGIRTLICHYRDDLNMTSLERFFLTFGNQNAKSFLLPCALICVLSAVIVAGILRNRKSGITSTKNYSREIRAAVNLLLVAALYFVLNMPYVIVWTTFNYMNQFVGLNKLPGVFQQSLMFLGELTTSLTIMNYALNFIIYCSSLEFYKVELLSIVSCGKVTKNTNKKKTDESITLSSNISVTAS